MDILIDDIIFAPQNRKSQLSVPTPNPMFEKRESARYGHCRKQKQPSTPPSWHYALHRLSPRRSRTSPDRVRHCYATLLPAALVPDPTRAPHAASTSRRQSRVSANDTRPARLAPYERVPFYSLFSLANIPDCPQRLLEFLYDLISLD